MKPGQLYTIIILFAAIILVASDRFYISKLKTRFKNSEKQRIITSNKLATAKIIHENLNHVRDLIFKNMDFRTTQDTILPESEFFNFVTTCMNDLKLKLISLVPHKPSDKGRVATSSYDIQFVGDFFAFGELCAKFENSRRIIAIESFSAKKQDDFEDFSRKGKNILVTMRVNTYRIRK